MHSMIRRLARGTALGGTLALFATGAAAQVAPGTIPQVPTSNQPGTVFTPAPNGTGGNTLTVNLRNAPATIINWRSFDIGRASETNFISTNARDVPNLTSPFSVLNRVTSGNPTQILGRLTSQPNISVWLLNPSGIAFNGSAAVSTGSFVASTLAMDDREFMGGNYRLFEPEGGAGAITLGGQTAIAALGAGRQARGVVLVAPTIVSRGSVDGGAGDVAFVAASDATIAYNPGGLMSVTIARGARLAARQVVGGTVEGRNVYLAVATRQDVNDALLQIDGDVHAEAGANGLIIAAGRGQGSTPGIAFDSTFGPGQSNGAVRLAANAGSALSSTDDIWIGGASDARLLGAVDAGGSYIVEIGTGALTLGGLQTAGRDIIARAGSIEAAGLEAGRALSLLTRAGGITLDAGTAGAAANVSAAGTLDVLRLTGRDTVRIAATGEITLGTIESQDGFLAVRTRTAGVTGRSLSAGAGVVVEAGTDIDISTVTSAGGMSLTASRTGTVAVDTARLGGAAGITAGAIAVGSIEAGSTAVLTARDSIVADTVRADARVALTAQNGDVRVGEARATNGDVTLMARRGAVTGVLSGGVPGRTDVTAGGVGAVTVRASEAAVLGTLRAARAVSVTTSAGPIDVTSARSSTASVAMRASGGDLTLGAGQAATSLRLASDAALMAGALSGGSGVEARATGPATIASAVSSGGDVVVRAEALDIARANAGGRLSLTAATGAVMLGNGVAGGNARIGAATDALVQRGLTAGLDASVIATGTATIGAITATSGDVRVSAGAITVGSVTAGTDLALVSTAGALELGSGSVNGGATLDGAGDVTVTGLLQSRGASSVSATGAAQIAAIAAIDDSVSILGETLDIGRVAAGGGLTLRASAGALNLRNGVVGGDAKLIANADAIVTRGLRGDTIAINATGIASLGAMTATSGNAVVHGNTVTVREASAAGRLALTARTGAIRLAAGAAGGIVRLNAATDLTVRGNLTATDFIHATAGGLADIADASTTARDVYVRAASIALDSASAGGVLALVAQDGALSLGSGTAGRGARLSATGAVDVVDVLTAGASVKIEGGAAATLGMVTASGGHLNIAAQSVDLAGAVSRDSAALRALAGDLSLGTGNAGGVARLTASGDLSVTQDYATRGRLTIDAGEALSGGTVASRDGTVGATAGGTAQLARVSAGRDIAVVARNVAVTTAQAGGSLRLSATDGAASLGSGIAGTVATLNASGDIVVRNTMTSRRDSLLLAGGAIRARDIATTDGAITLTAGGSIGGIGAQPGPILTAGGRGRDITVTTAADQSVRLAAVDAGGDVAIDAGTITTGRLAAGQRDPAALARGDVRLVARSEGIAVRGVDATGSATLVAPGDVAIARTVAADRGVTINAGGGLAAGALVSARSAIAARGETVSVERADAATGLALVATAGDLALGSGTAGGEARLVATGTVTAAALTANGDVAVRAADIAAGGLESRTGTLAVAARGGDLTGVTPSGATLIAGGNIGLRARGAAVLDRVQAGGDVRLDTDTMVATAVRAGGEATLEARDALTAGTVGARGAVSLSTVAGSIAVGEARSTGGAVSLIAARGAVTGLTPGGVPGRADISSGSGAVTVLARDAAVLGTIQAGGPVTVGVTAGDLDGTRFVSAAGSVALSAGGDLVFGSTRAAADGTVRARGSVTGETLRAGSAARVISGDDATVAMISAAGGDVRVRGATLDLGRVDAGGDLRIDTTRGALDLARGNAGGTARVISAGDVTVTERLTAVGVADIRATGSATIGRVDSTGGMVSIAATAIGVDSAAAAAQLKLSARAGDIRLGAGNAGRDADLTALGDVLLGVIRTRTGDIAIASGGNVGGDTAMLQAGGGIDLGSGGIATFRSVDAGRAVRMDASSIDIGTATAGRDLALTARARDIALDTGTAGGDVRFAAAAAIRVAQSLDARGAATLTAGADARLASIAGDALTIEAAGAIIAGSLLARGTGGALIARAGDSVRVDTVTSRGGAIRIVAGDAGVARLGQVSAANDVAVSAGSIDAAVAVAGGALRLTANTGTLALDSGRAASSATLASAGGLDVGRLVAVGDAVIRSGGELAIRDALVTRGAAIVTAASPAEIGTIIADGAIALRAGAVTAARLASSGAGVSVTAARGSATLDRIGAADAVTIAATGSATLGQITAGTDVTVTAQAIDLAAGVARTGALRLTATGGGIALGDGHAGAEAALIAARTLDIRESLTAGADVVLTAAGAARIGAVTAGGALDVGAEFVAATQLMSVGAGVRAATTQGDAAIGMIDAAGSVQIDASGGADIGSLRGGTAVSITATNTAMLGAASAGDGLTIDAASVAAGTLEARAGALTLTARTGDVGIDVALAAGPVGVTAAGTARLGTVTSGGATTLVATGSATLGTVQSAGDISVDATAIDATGLTASGSGIDLLARRGGVTLGRATAGTGLTITATDRVAIAGSVVATDGLTITAPDLDLGTEAALRTPDLRLTNSTPGAGIALGDLDGASGFSLSDAEIARIAAASLTVDGGDGAVMLGRIAFGADTGSSAIRIATTGEMTVRGTVSTSGAARQVTLGGGLADSTTPSLSTGLYVYATPAGDGGKLLFAADTVELRADRIGVGQAAGFLDAIRPLSAVEAANLFTNNPNSTLYNAANAGRFGFGQAYADAGRLLLSANAITVRYGTFALFQNTGARAGVAGASAIRTGAELGGTTLGDIALTLAGPGAAVANTFSLFGTIDGRTNESAAVVGGNILTFDGIQVGNSRVNGCVIGSAAGCLTTPIGIPPINIFDASRLDILTPADFAIAFDPVIGSNNEALFAGIAVDVPLSTDPCPEGSQLPACVDRRAPKDTPKEEKQP